MIHSYKMDRIVWCVCAYFAIIFFGKRKVKPEKSIQRKTDGFLSYYIYNILQRSITWTVVNCPLLTCITTLLLSLIRCFSDILIRMLESYKTVRNPWQFWIFVYSQLCQLAGLPQNKWGWPSTLETASGWRCPICGIEPYLAKLVIRCQKFRDQIQVSIEDDQPQCKKRTWLV